MEEWRKINNFPNYSVSNFGNVMNIKTTKILKLNIKGGYYHVSLVNDFSKKLFKVHRLVAILFIENSENKPEVNHKDKNKLNNNISNLEWNTRLENCQHRSIGLVYKSNKNKPILRLNKDTNEELEFIKDKLDIATDDRVIKTKSKNTLEYLIILKTDDEYEDYTYYIIRCQKRAIKQRLDDNSNYREVKRIECVPNSTNLFNRIKEQLKNYLNIKSNKLNLIDITETEFLNKIDLINEAIKII